MVIAELGGAALLFVVAAGFFIKALVKLERLGSIRLGARFELAAALCLTGASIFLVGMASGSRLLIFGGPIIITGVLRAFWTDRIRYRGG